MSAVKNRIFSVLLSVVCILSLVIGFFPQNIHAAGDKTLTIICFDDDTALVGMKWKIYKIGERANNDFILTGDFADYLVSLSNLDEESMAVAAKTLENYALADGIAPLAQGEVDKNGEKQFTSLEDGIYLASSEIFKVENHTYTASPVIIEVGAGKEAEIFAKLQDPQYLSVEFDVKKVWVGDENNLSARPDNITVELYRDDEVYDSVVLNESNGWNYSWDNLPGGFKWYTVERNVPENYNVSIDSNDTQSLIKNSYVSRVTVTTTIATGVVTTTTTASKATTTASGSTGKTTTTSTGNKIPQTGQLWWPVIPLSIVGFLMIAAGLMLKSKRNKSDAE